MEDTLLICRPHPFDPKALPTEEHKAISAAHGPVGATPGVTPGLPLGLPA